MPVTAGDIEFSVQEVRPGRKLSWVASSSFVEGTPAETLALPADLPVEIVSPRPMSERTGRLHTPWDKWFTGEQWGGKGGMTVGVRFGKFPYTIELTGDLTTSGVTIDNDALTITHTFSAAGTYNFRITVFDSDYESDYVDVSLTVYASNDANILNHFRVIDFSAGVNGTGTPASPFNAWSSFWGTDWSVSISPTIIALMKGTGTVTSATLTSEPAAAALDLGTNRPRALIGAASSSVTFALNTIAKHFHVATAGENDCWMKGFTLSGVRAADANMIRASQFGFRTHWLDLIIRDASITDSASANIGCIGGDGSAYNKNFSIVANVEFNNIDGANTNSSLITFIENDDMLIDRIALVDIGGGGATGWGIRFKHDTLRSEVRRVTQLAGAASWTGGGGTIGVSDAGGNATDVFLVRHCNVQNSGNCFTIKNDASKTWGRILLYNNTLRGPIVFPSSGAIAGSTLHASRNIIENAQSNSGWGTIDADFAAIAGESSMLEDNLNGTAGTLTDANGVPLLPANNGYGHSLAYLSP